MKAYIIHENDEWSLPLKEKLQKLSVPFEDWHMAKVNLNTSSIPPNGVFYNRMRDRKSSGGDRLVLKVCDERLYQNRRLEVA